MRVLQNMLLVKSCCQEGIISPHGKKNIKISEFRKRKQNEKKDNVESSTNPMYSVPGRTILRTVICELVLLYDNMIHIHVKIFAKNAGFINYKVKQSRLFLHVKGSDS